MEATLFHIQRFCLHDGFGIRTTVFFKGCNLRCMWCANPESQLLRLQPELEEALRGRVWTLEEVLDEVMKDQAFYQESGGGVTLSGGEPLQQADFAAALCDALHERHVTVGIETAADVPREAFLKVFSRLDFAQMDLKHWDDTRHRAGTGVGLERILANLRLALAGRIPVFPRIPVIPGFNDSLDDARAFGVLLTELGAKTVQLLPFHQMGEKKYQEMELEYSLRGVPQLHNDDLKPFGAVLEEAGLTVQMGG